MRGRPERINLLEAAAGERPVEKVKASPEVMEKAEDTPPVLKAAEKVTRGQREAAL